MIEKSHRPDFQLIILALAGLLGVAAGCSYWWHRGSLWEDEIIAITHGLQPLPQFFVEILRNDIHPFFYFLLLKFWTAIDPGSDSWALASSVVCALISAGTIAWISYRAYGRRTAFWATGLFCALPSFAWSAGNLRMYGLVPALAVACWYTNREFLRTGNWRWVVAMLLLQFLHAYTHAIGFFFVAFFALAALIEQWTLLDRRRLRIWLISQAASVLSMLPVVGSALVRGTEGLSPPTPLSLLIYPAELIPGGQALGGLTFLLLLLYGVRFKVARIPVLVIPCGALLACIVISSMGKPMFKPPVFMANLIPFLVIGASVGISRVEWRPLRWITLAYIAYMSIHTWMWAQEPHEPENYQPSARYILENTRPGDVVVIPHPSVYWGIMRYAVGPRWGYPLEVMSLENNDKWAALERKLGPNWTMRLGLIPETDHVDSQGVCYVIGNNAGSCFKESARLWVVHRDNYKESVRVDIPVRVDKIIRFDDELSVSLLVPDAAGTMSIQNPHP